MKITALTAQRQRARVNVFVDGTYHFSLDPYQVVDLRLKVGAEYTPEQLKQLIDESAYGKLYGHALEYTMIRPHSRKEIRDYVMRKVLPRRQKDGQLVPGVSVEIAERVLERLDQKGYMNDEAFARYWVDNRSQIKGASLRKLTAELRGKGVATDIIDQALADGTRQDQEELQKVIAKKAARYPDRQKFMSYLARQGFDYDDIKAALANTSLE